MTDIETFDCVRCGGEHPIDGTIDCPADEGYGPVSDDGAEEETEEDDEKEDDDQSVEELQANAVEEIGEAHVAAMVCVRFPTEDNDLDRMAPTSTSFAKTDALSLAQILAARTVIEEGLEDLGDRFERSRRSKPRPVGMPVSLAELVGGSSAGEGEGAGGKDPEGWGFQ